MNKERKAILDLVLILTISSLSFIYFYKIILATDKILVHGDYRYGLTVQQHIQYHLNEIFAHAPKLPLLAVLYLAKIVFGDISAEKIFTVFVLFVSTFFIYLSNKHFLKRIFGEDNWKISISAFIGSLLFLYNPWTINKIHHHYWLVLSLASSYLLLAEIDKFVHSKTASSLRILYISFLLTIIATQVQGLILYLGVMLVLYVLCFAIFEGRKFLEKFISKKTAIAIFIILFLNLFWILPQLLTLFFGISKPGSYGIVAENIDTLSRRATILNVFSAINMFIWKGIGHLSTVIYDIIIHGVNIWRLLSLVPITIAVSSLLFLKSFTYEKRKYLLYFAVLLIFSILISTGSYYPVFGDLYRKIFLDTSLGWVIRDPYKNTGLVIVSFSLLISILSYVILTKKQRQIKFIVAVFIVFSILIWGWPALTGDLNGHLNPYLVKYPKDLEKTIDYIETNLDYGHNIWWYPPVIERIYFAYNDVPHISSSSLNLITLENEEVVKYIEDTLKKGDVNDITTFLNKLSVKYVVLRHDLIESKQKQRLASDIRYFENLFNEYKTIEFGNFTVYKIKNSDQIVKVKPIITYSTSPSLNKDFTFNNSVQYIYFENNFYVISSHLVSSPFNEYIIKIKSEHHAPEKYWSLSTFTGGWLKKFVPYLEKFGIENWQSDYGYGLVFTWAENTNLSILFSVDKSDYYKLLIRYLKNQKGGEIKVYLDGKPIEIKTKDQLNKFVWKELGTFYLEKGKHELVLENVDGFNAVNLFVLIPEDKYYKAKKDVNKLFKNKTIIYLFEAESDLYRKDAGISKNINFSNGEAIAFGKNGKAWQDIEIAKNGTYRIALRGVGKFLVKIGNYSFIISSKSSNFSYSPLFYLNEGKYVLEIVPLNAVNPLENPSFEEWYAGLPESWNVQNVKLFEVEKSKEAYNGMLSIKVSTFTSKKGTWSWIRSNEINVKSGEEYLIITHIKAKNVQASHIPIEGYFENENKWKQLGQCPAGLKGTFDWNEFSCKIKIPENVTKIRVVLNAGWVLDKSKGEAITWFDDIQVIPLSKAPKLDVVWLYSTEENKTVEQLFEAKEKPAEVVNYTKVNPTLWKVKVNASKPFMLSFAEAYDPLWEARVYKDGEKLEVVKSIPLYSVINGFWINETGELEIIIRYKPQDWFEIGLAISALTFFACIGYLFYDWRREKGDRWARRVEKRIKSIVEKAYKRR